MSLVRALIHRTAVDTKQFTMTKPTLLVLAAGMGSRYGGLKQIDPVGPAGETIIDYSIFDAMRTGFGKLVFVIRHDIEAAFREAIGARFEKRLPVEYVFQELNKLPEGFSVPLNRTKPWGTGQAILVAEDVIREPFAAINADDFYGAASFRVLAQHLQSEAKDYAMVGFTLRNTLSEFGSVARGACQVGPDGYLQGVRELTKIERDGNGASYVQRAALLCTRLAETGLYDASAFILSPRGMHLSDEVGLNSGGIFESPVAAVTMPVFLRGLYRHLVATGPR